VHLCIAIPPKYVVASVIGFMKGKSAIHIARLRGKERNFTGESFGHVVTTCPRPASMKSKSKATSGNKKARMRAGVFSRTLRNHDAVV
jgi:REP element-mobilizing transposase RayT